MSGVPITIPGLPAAAPATNDSLIIWDQNTGLTAKILISDLAGIYAALTGAAFSGTVDFGATTRLSVQDMGTGAGRTLIIERNSNVTTPAPGSVAFRRANNAFASIWPDNSMILRIDAIAGVDSTQVTGGTVVGSQSSSLDVKDVLGDPLPPNDILALVAEGAAAVRRFQYKAMRDPVYDDEGNATGEYIDGPRPYDGEEFSGVVVDYAARYGTDVDEAHPNGRSLNTINAIGDLLLAVDWLVAQNDELRARVAALEEA